MIITCEEGTRRSERKTLHKKSFQRKIYSVTEAEVDGIKDNLGFQAQVRRTVVIEEGSSLLRE